MDENNISLVRVFARALQAATRAGTEWACHPNEAIAAQARKTWNALARLDLMLREQEQADPQREFFDKPVAGFAAYPAGRTSESVDTLPVRPFFGSYTQRKVAEMEQAARMVTPKLTAQIKSSIVDYAARGCVADNELRVTLLPHFARHLERELGLEEQAIPRCEGGARKRIDDVAYCESRRGNGISHGIFPEVVYPWKLDGTEGAQE